MSVPLIAVIYDGITNSVFESQVLQPLIAAKQKEPDKPIWLVSFESNLRVSILASLNAHGLHCVVYKKIKFIGRISLRIAAYHLKKFLSQFEQYELLARGPLAGCICLYSVDKNKCTQLTIQARGLLAEEYAYTHRRETNYVLRFLHALRKKQLYMLEKYVYGTAVQQNSPFAVPVRRSLGEVGSVRRSLLRRMYRRVRAIQNYVNKFFFNGPILRYIFASQKHSGRTVLSSMSLIIQAVSPALGDYLIVTYKTPIDCIRIATHDIPSMISVEQRNSWRLAMRTHMNIAHDAHVYCYNGSIKPWQFPCGVLEFFEERYKEDNTCVLVILTQDKKAFESLVSLFALPSHAYRIYTVPHTRIYEYLAACDIGMLFREETIVNWTSRPTKLLEYQAVGLEVVHNNTVAYAIKK